METLIELHLRTLSVCTLVNLSVKAQQMVPPGTGKHNRALLTNYDLHIMYGSNRGNFYMLSNKFSTDD